jgi:Cu/Ag efflux pump CusA
VVIAEEIVDWPAVRGGIVPATTMTVTELGETANEKANELLFHLGLATVSIVLLVAFSIGWREAVVVAIVIPTTILLTLFASRMMGYTLNRVSLFALIFSIGILVDDAIVIIENIARHGRWRTAADACRHRGGRRGRQPDHRRHLTVAALLPMFRLGADGPVHEPDPGDRQRRDAVLLRRR